MVRKGILSPVDKPTVWVSQFVVCRKKSDKLRICIDPKPLNKALKREHYHLQVLDDVLPCLNKAKVFTKLDLASAFWHIQLDEESSLLTTFNTPYGRYRWLRLPFGMKVSSEIFQKHLNQVLEGLVGVICIADDIVVYGCGETVEEARRDHDVNLANLLKRCREKNVKLSYEKSKFHCEEIPFMGHLITSGGLKPDPAKIDAVVKMTKPTDVKSIQRFIGFVTYLSRFLPDLSDHLELLRRLIKTNQVWTESHDKVFESVKRLVTSSPVLAYYNPEEDLVIQCDSSGTGVGAALLQNDQPIAYASRTLADVETRYAPIEKEMLAVVYSLERFHQYTYGRHTVVYSDHKPLEMILKKPLIKAPKRLQNMILRVQKYDFTLFYKPGKTMYLADTLSRAHTVEDKDPIIDEVDINVVTYLPMSHERLSEIKRETACDSTLQTLMTTISNGWPQERANLPECLMSYWSFRDELAVHDSLNDFNITRTFKVKFLACNVFIFYKNSLCRLQSSCSRHDVNNGVKFK